MDTTIVVVATRASEVPVIVAVAVTGRAEAAAVSVSVLLVVVGLVPHTAVTPLGRPDATRVTLPVKPFTSVTVTVLGTPAAPGVGVRMAGEAESVKSGVALTVRAIVVVAVRPPEVPVM